MNDDMKAGSAGIGAKGRGSRDAYLYAALAMVLVSTLYWSAFALNAYSTFHEYNDLGAYAYSLYYDLHYPSAAHGLQYIIFGNHISPDELLFLPIFYISQSALTLLFIQALVVSLAGLAAFGAARRVTGSGAFAMLLCAAVLLNPGLHGITVFDFHVEMLFPLLFIAAFYFYVRMMRLWFYAASVLLVGVIEEAPFLGIALGMALAAHALLNHADAEERRARLRMAYGLLALSAAAFLLYYAASGYINGQYAAGAYPLLPPGLRYDSSLSGVASGLGLGQAAPHTTTYTLMTHGSASMVYYALLIIVLGLGVLSVFVPVETLLLLSPWLAETFLVGNFQFVYIFNQYFAYVIGGMAVAAILGAKALMERKGRLANALWQAAGAATPKVVAYASVISIAVILMLSPFFIYSRNVNSMTQDFLFQVSPSQQRIYAQLYSVMDQVPPNASLMAQYYTMPHVFARRYFETTARADYFFRPQYILLDDNLNISLNVLNLGYHGFYAFYMNNTYNYTVAAENGTAVLYVRR